jgi:hypothetical protein
MDYCSCGEPTAIIVVMADADGTRRDEVSFCKDCVTHSPVQRAFDELGLVMGNLSD